jgi:hypothetical protein
VRRLIRSPRRDYLPVLFGGHAPLLVAMLEKASFTMGSCNEHHAISTGTANVVGPSKSAQQTLIRAPKFPGQCRESSNAMSRRSRGSLRVSGGHGTDPASPMSKLLRRGTFLPCARRRHFPGENGARAGCLQATLYQPGLAPTFDHERRALFGRERHDWKRRSGAGTMRRTASSRPQPSPANNMRRGPRRRLLNGEYWQPASKVVIFGKVSNQEYLVRHWDEQ